MVYSRSIFSDIHNKGNPELWILLTKELYLVTNQAKSILFDHLDPHAIFVPDPGWAPELH